MYMADRLLLTVSVLSLLGTLGLYGYAVLVPPDLLAGPGPGDSSGRYVAVEGLVREVYNGWGGELDAEILPEGRPPGVWLVVPADIDGARNVRNSLLTGAEVHVEGVIAENGGRMEMTLQDGHHYRLVAASSLGTVRSRPDLLDNVSVSLAGKAFYKKVWRDYLTFRLLDLQAPSIEVNCSASRYNVSAEDPAWENGTAIRVFGWLSYPGDPPSPHVYLSGGNKGVELPG